MASSNAGGRGRKSTSVTVHKSEFARSCRIVASASTPSTRRLLDGVAMPGFLAARFSYHGRVAAEK